MKADMKLLDSPEYKKVHKELKEYGKRLKLVVGDNFKAEWDIIGKLIQDNGRTTKYSHFELFE